VRLPRLEPLNVRPAQADEAEALGAIGFSAWAEGEHGDLDGGRGDRQMLRAEYVKFCLTMAATMLVVQGADGPVGWGAREDGDDYISDLWVMPAAQGRGAGSALLGALERQIAAAGYLRARLETRFGAVRAIRFYERHGYAIDWRKEKFSSSLGYAIDKVGLSKPLTE
jgi:ribosomal-protein-alanine N-acetyltransferase